MKRFSMPLKPTTRLLFDQNLFSNVFGVVLGAIFLFLSCQTTPTVDNDVNKSKQDANLGDLLKQSVSGDEFILQQYKTIYVYPFLNGTSQSEILSVFQDRLRREFSLNSRLTLTSELEKADVILQGKITQYKEIPREYDTFGQATRFDLTAMVTIAVKTGPNQSETERLKGNADQRLIHSRERIRFDTYYNARGGFSETKLLAQQRLFEGLSRRVVLTVFNGWYTEDKTIGELNYNPDAESTESDKNSIRTDLSFEERRKIEEQLQKNKDLNRKPHQ